MARGNFLAAEKALEEVLSRTPDDAEAHALLAQVLLAQDVKEPARRHIARALELAPDLAYAHYVQSSVRLTDLRMYSIPLLGGGPDDGFAVRKAVKDVREALRLAPDEVPFHLRLAELEALLNRWPAALAAADAALRLEPEDVPAAIARAEALNRRRRRAEARATLHRALAANPEVSDAHAGLGWALLEAGDDARASQFFEEALRLNALSPWAQDGLFECAKHGYVAYRIVSRFRYWLAAKPLLVRVLSVGVPFAGFLALMNWLSALIKRRPELEWIPATLLGVFLLGLLWFVLADAVCGLLARRARASQSGVAEEQRRAGAMQLAALGFGLAGAAFAIFAKKISREFQWGAFGLVPGLYGLWIVRQVPQPRLRRWAWAYAALILAAGIPVALLLEGRFARLPGWGVLAALLGPILPLAIGQELAKRADAEARRQAAKQQIDS
jgi:tetratricopeptide (TPR) repeat protein